MAMDMPADEEEKKIQDELGLPILLADRVIKSAQVAGSSKLDCKDLANITEHLRHMLRSTVQLAESTHQPLYERPIRRIISDVTKNLERALTLARRCRRGCVLRRLFAITTAADFRKASNLLESSIADLKWVHSIFDDTSEEGGTDLSLPPIAQNDPILSWVWSYIASLQMGQLRNRIEAANELASLARDNDRTQKLIVEEGGIVPLLRLLKEEISADAQVAASTALCSLCTDRQRVRLIAKELAVPMIVKVLGDSPMRVQVWVANLVSRMSEMDSDVQEEFGRENVTKLLVTFLSVDIVSDDDPKLQSGNTALHSLVQINKELAKNPFNQSHHSNCSSLSSLSLYHKKDNRGVESPELKLKLKISCAEALWKLSKASLLNSRKITEAKGLLCLAKIIEQERGDLRINCLMIVMELTAVAEFNADFRRVAFKPNSPAAKAVLDQLLRVINEESNPKLLLPTIKSIGCLARTFPAKDTRIVLHLVAQLSHRNAEVVTEAAIALGKFVSPDNFNCVEHSKVIVEFDVVPLLMKLLRTNDHRRQVHELVLLCYLALHCGNSKAFEQERTLKFIEEKARSPLAQHPDMKQLFSKAMDRLSLYEDGHTHP